MRVPTRIRRHRWRRLTAVLSAVAALIIVVAGAQAGGWCRADPIIQIEGEVVQIWAAIPEEHQNKVNGPIDVRITLPTNRNHSVIFTDSGFNGHGETVTFINGGKATGNRYEIDVFVSVPFNSGVNPASVPLQIEVITALETKIYTGTANGVLVNNVIVPKWNY